MKVDLELYRREVRLPGKPSIRLSAIDIAADCYQDTLVFLHGFAGHAMQWRYQLRAFSDENRVIALDLRGHGRSDRPRGAYDMAEIQADLAAALVILGVNQRFVLLGHSFGGAIAAEYACANPQRVNKLVLVAMAGEFRLNALYRLLLRLPYSVLQSASPFVRSWLHAPPHVLKAMYQQTLCHWNGWSLFRDITIPTLVIRGHMDILFARPAYEEVARLIPGAEEVDVGASGHMVMLERREAVNRAIERYLRAEQGGWRTRQQAQSQSQSEGLLAERPWLRHYDERVPRTVAIPHVPLQHMLRSAVRRFPLKTALFFEGNRLTYRRLNREVNRFANALLACGLARGERVMLLLPNIPQLVIAYYGVLKAGGAAVFTLPDTQPAELVRQIRQCGARVVITLTRNAEWLDEIKSQQEPEGAPLLEHVIVTHAGDYLPWYKRLALSFTQDRLNIPLSATMHVWNRMLYSHTSQSPEIEIDPEDLATIIFTGGVTDAPKGVMLSHRNLVANAIQTRHWIPDAREGRERFLCALPFAHSYGLTTALNVPIALGATLILKPRFEVKNILKTIKRQRPTIFPGVPQMYVAIKDYPGVRKYGIASIKACISGSAPLPVEVQEAFEKLTRGRLVEGYGLTEASPVTHGNPLMGLRKVGSIGVPFPSTEARIVDLPRGDHEMPIGQIGELSVRGPQVMLGYLKNTSETRRVLSDDGWLLTGDVAQVDSDGYFRIIARRADMWYPSKPGEPAFPRDVEEVLYEVPQVKEVAVVAIGGQPVAFVIASETQKPKAEHLIAYCQRRLPPDLTPRLVIFMDDFPRTFIGKVSRRALARQFEQSQQSSNQQGLINT